MARTLRGGTEPGIPELVNGLKHRDRAERLAAALLLGQMGKAARKAVPALVEALKDDNRQVKRAAVLALGDIGPDARAAVPALSNVLLTEEEAMLRRRAAVALGRIGAGEANPALKEAHLHDDDEGVQDVTAAALAQIDGRAVRRAA